MKREHPYRLIYRVSDLDPMDYDAVKTLLDENGVEYDWIRILRKSGRR